MKRNATQRSATTRTEQSTGLRARSRQNVLTRPTNLLLPEEKPHRRRKSFWFFRNITKSSEMERSQSADIELMEAWDQSSATGGHSLICFDDEDASSRGSASTDSSLSTVGELHKQETEVVIVENHKPKRGGRLRVIFRRRRPSINSDHNPGLDLQQYMAKREMTATQERWNALTMIPSPVYCLYFLATGAWVNPSMVSEAKQEMDYFNMGSEGLSGQLEGISCVRTGLLDIPAIPPLPVLAVAFAIVSHAPFSFLYHWRYAHTLPAGAPRTTHWSRRMDQSMIHVASAFLSYATSGSWDFFLANVLFNAECIYRQFKHKVRPRRNKIRILISVVSFTIPMIQRGDLETFVTFWAIIFVSGWLFVQYPLGGWSHSAFHLVVTLIAPLLLAAARELPASQDQLRVAATCSVLKESL